MEDKYFVRPSLVASPVTVRMDAGRQPSDPESVCGPLLPVCGGGGSTSIHALAETFRFKAEHEAPTEAATATHGPANAVSHCRLSSRRHCSIGLHLDRILAHQFPVGELRSHRRYYVGGKAFQLRPHD